MEEIKKLVERAVRAACDESASIELSVPDQQFGDYATNVALQLGKKLGNNPRELAEKIVAGLPKNGILAKVSIAGPGFINIKLTDQALIKESHRRSNKLLQGKVVVAEYSDPNPFKVLHAGHLYTTITGDAIASLLENAGAKVHRLNYGGDVGLHVGRTMWAIVRHLGGEKPQELQNVDPKKRPEWMSERYVEGNSAYEDNPEAKAEIIAINKKIYQLHADKDHQSNLAKIYWTCREWSYEGFDALYAELRIDPFEKYIAESEVTPLGLELVERGQTEGVFEKSEGAIVFKGEPHGLHTRVFINSEGLPTYEAKDLGLAAKKWQDYKFDLNIIVTANDIVEYMKVVLQALSNFYPEVAARSKHFTHGVIKLPGGVKMSSRKGNILRAADILDAAREASQAEREGDNEDSVLAAVKYAVLKQRIGGDIIYDPAESVNLAGNSGPYLQYAHARARSILTKVKSADVEVKQLEDGERSLVRKLAEYASTVEQATRELMPHHICTYLYELSQEFNRFYENNRVIDDPRQGQRLTLVKQYADTLKNGLELLNIPAPEKM